MMHQQPFVSTSNNSNLPIIPPPSLQNNPSMLHFSNHRSHHLPFISPPSAPTTTSIIPNTHNRQLLPMQHIPHLPDFSTMVQTSNTNTNINTNANTIQNNSQLISMPLPTSASNLPPFPVHHPHTNRSTINPLQSMSKKNKNNS